MNAKNNNEYGIGDFLLTFKPLFLLSFFFIHSALCVTGVIVDGGINRPIKTLGGLIVFAVASAFLFLCTITPLLSKNVQKIVCNPEGDFKAAKVPLIFLAVMGAFFAVGASWSAISMYTLNR